MRKTKRELLAADSTGDKDRFTEKSVLLRRQREDYNKFSKAAGLLTQNERTQVGGYGHSQASKASWAVKNGGTHKLSSGNGANTSGSSSQNNSSGALTSGSNSGIITPNYKFTEDTSSKFRKAFNAQYDKAVKIFGDITTIDTVGVLYAPRNSGNYGEFSDNTRLLTIRYADDNDFIKTMTGICKNHHENGEWSTENARHTIRHEIGHAIYLQHKLNDPDWLDKCQKLYGLFDQYKNSITDVTDATRKDVLSIYGFESHNEMVSECIAEYLGGSPRDFAKRVVNIILKGEDTIE